MKLKHAPFEGSDAESHWRLISGSNGTASSTWMRSGLIFKSQNHFSKPWFRAFPCWAQASSGITSGSPLRLRPQWNRLSHHNFTLCSRYKHILEIGLLKQNYALPIDPIDRLWRSYATLWISSITKSVVLSGVWEFVRARRDGGHGR